MIINRDFFLHNLSLTEQPQQSFQRSGCHQNPDNDQETPAQSVDNRIVPFDLIERGFEFVNEYRA